MDWQISPPSRASSRNGAPFEPGNPVVTILYLLPGGVLERCDLHESETHDFSPPPSALELGRWRRVIRAPEDRGDTEARRRRLQSAEELFLALYENEMEGEGGESGTVPALKHLLGLILERKRLLKPLGRRKPDGKQLYRHVATGREFEVPVLPFDETLLLHVRETLGELV